MQLHRVIALAMAVVTASTASNVTSKSDLNGWYPCSEYTFSDEGSSTGQVAQCAVYSAPLCYPGICETPEGVNSKVDVFVKRIPATSGNPDTASNVWLIQGGPGASSTDLESSMVTLHSQLEGAVNVYTMDHRGTGRSTLLDCVAAQVTTTGSPWGNTIDPSEVSACAEDLQIKYGDLASFSVTTAATDLATFIAKYTNGADTIVYGASYGTIFTERLMHLAPPQVTGHVLDGVGATSGAPADEFFYISKWDINFGEVGEAFMALCDTDVDCKVHFESKSLNNTLQGVIEQFDNDPNSTCAALVNSTGEPGITSPSFTLRAVLGSALMDANTRTLIPPVVYRLERCAPEDVDVLTQFFTTIRANNNAKSQDSAFESSLLHGLIVYSEIWETPMPSMTEMEARFTNTKMSSGGGVALLGSQYCAFSKEKLAVCDEFNVGNYENNGIVYKRDQPQTPNKYAEFLLNVLDGEKKELIAFEYATHGTVMTTPMVAVDPWSDACGMKLLASYVRNGGVLERLDKSCVNEMPAFNLTTPDDYLYGYFGTDDAYDGAYNSSLTSYS